MIGTAMALLAVLPLFSQDDRELTGIVEDAGGKPVSGVAVWLSSGWTGAGTIPARGRAVTDTQGRFAITIPDHVPHSRGTPEWLTVWAYQSGKAAGRVHVGPISEGRHEEIRLTLGPARPRRPTLRRPDGKPLEGATVRPLALVPSNEPIVRFYPSVPDELGTIFASKTDREGNV